MPDTIAAMDYLALLEHSYVVAADDECPPDNRLEFLSEHVFNFTTYDGRMGAIFADHALAVCEAITNGSTFDFIADPERYKWYLLLCNTPFFADKLEWGTSIRGAWWKHETITLATCGLWDGHDQIVDPTFTREEWLRFVAAVIAFGNADVSTCEDA